MRVARGSWHCLDDHGHHREKRLGADRIAEHAVKKGGGGNV